MRKLFLQVLVCTSICVGWAGTTLAADNVEQHRVVADTAEKFAATIKDLKEEMGAGGRYEFITTTDRAKANADIDAMTAMFEKKPAVAAMSADEKVRLFNAQENLNGILTHNDSNRLVCERRAPVGTNIPITTCKTYGELAIQRSHTQDYLKKAAMRPCGQSPGPGKICASD